MIQRTTITIQTKGLQNAGRRALLDIVGVLTDAGMIVTEPHLHSETDYAVGPGHTREVVSFAVTPPRKKTLRENIFGEVDDERVYQTDKWGVEADDTLNTPWMWTSYVCQYAAKWMTGLFTCPSSSVDLFRAMMIKTAATAIAAVESLDRQRAKNGKAFYEVAE